MHYFEFAYSFSSIHGLFFFISGMESGFNAVPCQIWSRKFLLINFPLENNDIKDRRNNDACLNNYFVKVVMDKGRGVKMDMRGRCSAGQKVTNSYIVRWYKISTCYTILCIILLSLMQFNVLWKRNY